MKICFIPIDNRPVCYNLAKDICEIDEAIDLLIPPRELLGSLVKTANIDEILNNSSNENYYDLQGRYAKYPVNSGIYVKKCEKILKR